MSHWNYKMARELVEGEEQWSIREVYYDDEGGLKAWSAEPIDAHGDTLDDLADDLIRMMRATTEDEYLKIDGETATLEAR